MNWLKYRARIAQVLWLNWRVKRLLREPGRLFKTLLAVPIAVAMFLAFLVAAVFVLTLPIWVFVKPDLFDLSGKNETDSPKEPTDD